MKINNIIRLHSIITPLVMMVMMVCLSCQEQKEHTASAILERDSVSMMRSLGVNSMISDSGVMRYRIVAERWDVNEIVNPKRWIFHRGIFMEQFDEKFHAEAYVQADSAYYYTEQHLWYLFGNVRVKTVDGLRFNSEELYWDQNRHELYSNLYSHVIMPERELEGSYFTSDEGMRHYTVSNSKGNFKREDAEGKKEEKPQQQDTTPQMKRDPAMPMKRR